MIGLMFFSETFFGLQGRLGSGVLSCQRDRDTH